MKFLIVQENGRHDKNRHMRECFSLQHYLIEKGHEAVCWGIGHVLYNSEPKLYLNKDFDVIICLENYDSGWLPADLNKSPCLKIFWSIDSHCALKNHLSFCYRFNPHIVLNSTKHFVNYFKDVSKKQYWFPNAVDTRWYLPTKTNKDIEIGFVGSLIYDRPIVLSRLSKTIGLKYYNRVLGEDAINLINRFNISFNKSISNDINYRVMESTACNTLLLTNYVEYLEELYDLNSEILVYNSIDEAIDIFLQIKENKKLQAEISKRGFNKTISKHSYDNRVDLLLEIINCSV